MSKTKIHQIWRAMLARCNNPNVKDYRLYGGRGISVCDRWQVFENFYADMGDRPSPVHSIDRKDVNGNYSPENCTWATNLEQGRNKRNTVRYAFQGQTKTLSEWAEFLGIKRTTLSMRIHNWKWTPEKAFSTPVRPR